MVLVVPGRVREAFGVVVDLAVLAVLAVLGWSGVQMVRMASTSILPAINIPVAYLYLPVPISAVLMMIEFADHCWGGMRSIFVGPVPPSVDEPRSSRGA